MRVIAVDPRHPDPATLREASELLRAGRLVVFPTETVYGLGAHALDDAAVERIYEAKGRPSLNPLIVHVADAAAARMLASDWTSLADVLAKAFWPGPLTLVVRKAPSIPQRVSAGQDTVGLRVPAHPVALALLRESRLPIAAPSANLSNQVSPTTADHVRRGLGERVDLILDGGATTVGIESTVVDVTGAVPRILRPGMISANDIARVAGRAEHADSASDREAPRSPGMLDRHYAPRARVLLFDEGSRNDAINEARAAMRTGRGVGTMVFAELPVAVTASQRMPAEPHAYASSLYATLHAMDDAGCGLILIERPPATDDWWAIRDRLERASR
jgi:L-threonylcarbamoyladenylate synthase